jgi:group I intron endonuclease
MYVGQSVNIERRLSVHKAKLRHQNHWNKHLQASWNLNGEESFAFKILEKCSEELLSKVERLWIEKLNLCDNSQGFNLTDGGEGGRMTPEVRKKMSEKAKGRKGYWTGKVIPEEARKKMSEAAKRRGCCKPTKVVIHLESGIKYKSCAEAARSLFPDIPAAVDVIYKVAKGIKPHYRKTTWKFED